MNIRPLAFLIVAMSLASLAGADAPEPLETTAVYESIDDITIGRVFLSPAERKQLDAIRHLPEQAAAAQTGAAPAPVAETPKPTGLGFIRVDGKATRVFRNGEFVAAPPGRRDLTALSDGVIVRHEDGAGDDSP